MMVGWQRLTRIQCLRPDDGLSLDANVACATTDSCARTSDWVSGLPDKCSQLGSFVSLSNVSVSPQNELSDSSSVTGSLNYRVESVSLEHSVISNPLADVSKVDADDVPVSDTGTFIACRSRFGRFIKPVNRLLCTMSGQNVVSVQNHIIQTV